MKKAKMKKAKRVIKTSGEAIITSIAWITYIFAIRPVVMAIDLIILVSEFIFDLAAFPIVYTRNMKESEGNAENESKGGKGR